MSKRKVYETRSGVAVVIHSRTRDLRRGKVEWKAYCLRWPSGGAHGWIWMRNLTAVES